MVLDHVADRAGGVVIRAPAAGHAHFLGHRDLHRGDVPAVPDRLEDAVAEPEGQDVLDRLLAQVMVDAIDLALVEHARDLAVQGPGAGEVVAERLLDDHPAPGGLLLPGIDQAGLAQVRDDRREELGRDGQVIDPVAARAVGAVELLELLLELSVRLRVVEGSGSEDEAAGELGPDLAEVGAAVLAQRLLVVGAEVVVGPVAAGEADDGAFARAGYPPGPGGRAPARACDGPGRRSSRRERWRRARAPGPAAAPDAAGWNRSRWSAPASLDPLDRGGGVGRSVEADQTPA